MYRNLLLITGRRVERMHGRRSGKKNLARDLLEIKKEEKKARQLLKKKEVKFFPLFVSVFPPSKIEFFLFLLKKTRSVSF